MALGELPLLRRHIERCLNVGMAPEQVVEVFIQLTFYVGVPATEAALRITKQLFEEHGVKFTPTQVYDTHKSVEELTPGSVPIMSTWATSPPTLLKTRIPKRCS